MPLTEIPPIRWRTTAEGREQLVSLVCPGCQEWHGLYGYEIDSEGKATPALECTRTTDKFQIKLIGWKPA